MHRHISKVAGEGSAYQGRLSSACFCIQPGIIKVCSTLGPFQGRYPSLQHNPVLHHHRGSNDLTVPNTAKPSLPAWLPHLCHPATFQRSASKDSLREASSGKGA